MKDEAYIINLDEYSAIETHWVALYVQNNNNVIYFDSFRYCLKWRKDTENINPRVSKTSNGRTMVLSKCVICGSKKSRFIKIKKQKDY